MPSWPPGWVGALAPITMHFAIARAFSTATVLELPLLPHSAGAGATSVPGDTSPGTTVPILGEKTGRDTARTCASLEGGGTGGQWGAG